MAKMRTVRVPFTSVELKRPVFVAYCLSVLHNVAFFIPLIGLPYFAKRNAINDTLFGYAQTLFGVLQIVGGPLFGLWMNKFGIKSGLFLCYAMTALMTIFLVLFDNVEGLFLSRLPSIFVHGMQAHNAVLAAVTAPGKERTTTFGKMGLCFGITFVIAPIINALSSKFIGPYASSYIAIAFSVAGLLVAHKFVDEAELKSLTSDDSNEDEKKKDAKDKKVNLQTILKIAREPNVLTVFLQKNIAVAPMHIPFAVMQLYLIEKFNVTESQNAAVQVVIGILIMIVNGVGISFLRARFAEDKLISIGVVSLLLVHSQFCHFTYAYQLAIILPFMATGLTLVNTVSDSILTASVAHDEQAIILGICTACVSFFRTVAPSVGGYILDNYSFAMVGYIGVLGCALSLALAALFPIKNLKGASDDSTGVHEKKQE